MTKIFDYELVYKYITGLIKNELKEHDKIPSENMLCDKFNITRATVRQGINKLKNEGLIYSKKGSGNFVSPEKITYKISPKTTFTEEIEKAGKSPSLKNIEIKKIKADQYIAKILDVDLNEEVLYIKNLRLVDGIPFLFAEYYINKTFLEDIEKKIKDTKSISKLYKEVYQLQPYRENSEIDILASNDEAKSIFDIQHDLPIIKISTKTIDEKTNKTIDYCCSNFRSDMAKIVVDYKGGNK